MSAQTSIEWTDRTWNPVTGCTKVSPGCKHCYAEAVAERFWAKQYGNVSPSINRPRAFTDVRTHADRLKEPLRWRKPCRVFVNSMSDLFHEEIPEDFLFAVFQTMGAAFWHTYQILTKRPVWMAEILPAISARLHDEGRAPLGLAWHHVYLGVSIENQETADERIPWLLKTPAAVRFLSVEPLLEPVNLESYLKPWAWPLHWVIVGGESGPGARPCELAWIRSVVDQCSAAAVPCFVKQLGAKPIGRCGAFAIRDRKGGDQSEWPEDLRVRQYPSIGAAMSAAGSRPSPAAETNDA